MSVQRPWQTFSVATRCSGRASALLASWLQASGIATLAVARRFMAESGSENTVAVTSTSTT